MSKRIKLSGTIGEMVEMFKFYTAEDKMNKAKLDFKTFRSIVKSCSNDEFSELVESGKIFNKEEVDKEDEVHKLHILCIENKFNPKYTIVSGKGTSEITVRAKVGEHVTYGKGRNKSEGKRCAAKNMLIVLQEVLDKHNSFAEKDVDDHNESKDENQLSSVNYVGHLHDMKQFDWPEPVFKNFKSIGPCEKPSWSVTCDMCEMITTGKGFTKRDAKQDAARKMVLGFMDIFVKEKSTNKLQDNKIVCQHPAVLDILQLKANLKYVEILTTDDAETWNFFKSNLKTIDCASFHQLDIKSVEPGEEVSEIIDTIARELDRRNWHFKTEALVSKFKRFSCMLSMGKSFDFVFHGSGDSVEEAENQAHFTAIQYLFHLKNIDSK